VPGDTLHIHVEKRYNRGNVWKFKGEARVGDTVMADATFAAMIVET
jgi:3-hydroxyacyl-[acyl-carrier-protein] dehydratase